MMKKASGQQNSTVNSIDLEMTTNNNYWITTLYISKVDKVSDMIDDFESKFQVNTYVLVYPMDQKAKDGKTPSHCVYVESFLPKDNQNPNSEDIVKSPITQRRKSPIPISSSTCKKQSIFNGRYAVLEILC